jgi:ribonuclease HI
VCTDGPFLLGPAGSAFFYNGQAVCYSRHGFNSFVTAQLHAVYRALLITRRQPRRHCLVCADSLGALRCVSGYSPDHTIVAEILTQAPELRTSVQSVVFCWVPGHCGLPGNEAADVVAKAAAVHGPLVSDRAHGGTYGCSCLRRAILSQWQDQWNKLCSETICAGVAILRHSRREKRSGSHAPPARSRAPDTWTLARQAGARLYTLRCPAYCGTYPAGLPTSR